MKSIYNTSPVETDKKFRNLLKTTLWGYEYEYVWICEPIGSWVIKL